MAPASRHGFCRLTDGRQAVVCGPLLRAARVAGSPLHLTGRLAISGPGCYTHGYDATKQPARSSRRIFFSNKNRVGSPLARFRR
jgi:hypothetical protein